MRSWITHFISFLYFYLYFYSYRILTEVAPIKKANIFVIDVTVMDTPASLSAKPTLSYAGRRFSSGVRLSIDFGKKDEKFWNSNMKIIGLRIIYLCYSRKWFLLDTFTITNISSTPIPSSKNGIIGCMSAKNQPQ